MTRSLATPQCHASDAQQIITVLRCQADELVYVIQGLYVIENFF